MARVDGYQEGWDAAITAAVKLIKELMGDRSGGVDIMKLTDAPLDTAVEKIANLSMCQNIPENNGKIFDNGTIFDALMNTTVSCIGKEITIQCGNYRTRDILLKFMTGKRAPVTTGQQK